MKENTKNTETPKKAYADFTLVIDYTYTAARKRGKARQTHRDDITALNYSGNGVAVDRLHPIAILYRKFLEEKPVTYRARIFDNRQCSKVRPIVFDVIFEKDIEHIYADRREEYYELSTGIKHKVRAMEPNPSPNISDYAVAS
ncbi:MAG: hypothetical protein KIS94_05685 [Chitinophagales bacterium]|nr:hypothetical protein [Chitinophagales bacterium]